MIDSNIIKEVNFLYYNFIVLVKDHVHFLIGFLVLTHDCFHMVKG